VLFEVAGEARRTQSVALNRALDLCSHAIVLRRSCGDDLSLEYFGHVTKLRSLLFEICTKLPVEIEEKGKNVTVWGKSFRDGARIFYRERSKVYLVVLSFDGSDGEAIRSVLMPARLVPNLITEKGCRSFYQMHMQPAVFIGMDTIPEHSFAYFVRPGDTETSQLNDDKNDPLWTPEEEIVERLERIFPEGYRRVERKAGPFLFVRVPHIRNRRQRLHTGAISAKRRRSWR
jgi:hypothetical protein